METRCHPFTDADFAFRHSFSKKLHSLRIPASASFAVTHRCTLRCRHCYLGSQEAIRGHRDWELTFDEITDIINQLVEAGTLDIVFTGGEPLLRNDFARIYEYAVRKGLLVSIMSNGTLFTDEIMAVFGQYPPRRVEVSMYGATEQTYEQVSRVEGSFERFLRGVDQLQRHRIRYRLKTVLMSINRHELSRMEEFSRERGVHFRYDSAVFSCQENCDNTVGLSGCGKLSSPGFANDPLDLRVPVDEVLAIDFETAERAKNWLALYNHEKDKVPADRLYVCGAGLTGLHIDPYGWMSPCLTVLSLKYDLRHGTLKKGWEGPLARFREILPGPSFPCNACVARAVCMGCPAVFELENGDPCIVSTYMCETAQCRMEKLKELL